MALSGMNFFSVTRGLILNVRKFVIASLATYCITFAFQIAAAIVTYEIFFIQYVNTTT